MIHTLMLTQIHRHSHIHALAYTYTQCKSKDFAWLYCLVKYQDACALYSGTIYESVQANLASWGRN